MSVPKFETWGTRTRIRCGGYGWGLDSGWAGGREFHFIWVGYWAGYRFRTGGAGGGPGSCTVNVTFTPTLAGALTGTLLVTSTNGGGQAGLALAGIGLDFQFTVIGSNTATVVQGQAGSYTLAVAPLGGTSGSFSFACGNLPANVLCLFNPAQLTGLRAMGNVQLTLSTGAPAVAQVSKRHPSIPSISSILSSTRSGDWGGRVLVVCGVLALPLGWWRRKSLRTSGSRHGGDRLGRVSLLLWMLIGLITGVSSCAGAGGSGGSIGQSHLGGGTPPGSYIVPVTASSAGVTRSLQVTLVVN
jgi:hypothetical protein